MIRRKLMAATAILIGSPALAGSPPNTIPAAGASGASGSAAQETARPLTDAERAQAMQELRDLQARMSALEARLGVTPPPSVQVTPPPPGRAKDHNLEVYGFVQLDAIQDFKRVDPQWDATLRPSRIPTHDGTFGSDGQSVFSVRQSRLGVKGTGEVAGKPYEVKFEFDLFGTGVDAGQTTFRVRHIYAKWGPILAGQTNTLFMDGDIFPNVVDYWGPNGMVFVRNPQLRFTFLSNKNWEAAIALEHPSDDIDPGRIRLIDEDLASNLQPDEKIPDLTAAIRYGGDWGHVRLAGLLRRIGFDTKGTADNEPHGHKTGWGINATSAINISPVTLRLGAVYGHGIATYMNDGGMDLAPTAALLPTHLPSNIDINELLEAKAVPLLGISAYVDINWTKQLTSAIGYSFDKVDNTNFQNPDAFHKGQYASANLLWSPVPDLLTGAEFLWGSREDKDGSTGHDFRVQGTFKWSFSSKNIWDWFE